MGGSVFAHGSEHTGVKGICRAKVLHFPVTYATGIPLSSFARKALSAARLWQHAVEYDYSGHQVFGRYTGYCLHIYQGDKAKS